VNHIASFFVLVRPMRSYYTNRHFNEELNSWRAFDGDVSLDMKMLISLVRDEYI
jgi:hypothetical protein